MDKKSIWLTRIKVALIREMFPDDYDELYDVLMAFKIHSEQYFDLGLTFEMAKLQFIKGEWDLSKITFDELRKQSRGFKYRLIPSSSDRWLEKGKPRKCQGIIVKPPTLEEWGFLRSHEPAISYRIPVWHKAMSYERYSKGDRVTFEIVFNMVGPQASNVLQR